jgi:hypothetical protein
LRRRRLAGADGFFGLDSDEEEATVTVLQLREESSTGRLVEEEPAKRVVQHNHQWSAKDVE